MKRVDYPVEHAPTLDKLIGLRQGFEAKKKRILTQRRADKLK